MDAMTDFVCWLSPSNKENVSRCIQITSWDKSLRVVFFAGDQAIILIGAGVLGKSV